MKILPIICMCLAFSACKRDASGMLSRTERYRGTVGSYPLDVTVVTEEESHEVVQSSSPMARRALDAMQHVAPSAVGLAANALLPGTGGIASALVAGAGAYFFGKARQKKQMQGHEHTR